MFWRRERTPYLVKANNDYVSWCECGDAPIGLPRQMSCPWCGCGWLFDCIRCGKAFTFAKAVLMASPLEKIAKLQVPIVQRVMSRDGEIRECPVARTAADWCGLMRPLLAPIELGKMYVYFDGSVVATDAAGVRLKGERRTHDLPFVPQVLALRDRAAAEAILSSIEYWTAEDRA
jgi:hypothetical protein